MNLDTAQPNNTTFFSLAPVCNASLHAQHPFKQRVQVAEKTKKEDRGTNHAEGMSRGPQRGFLRCTWVELHAGPAFSLTFHPLRVLLVFTFYGACNGSHFQMSNQLT